MRSEGRLAAVAALKCIVDRTASARGPRGAGRGWAAAGGMGSVRGVRAGRWAVAALMFMVLWA